VEDLNLKDITISGSNAAYSYTPSSDIDLHLIVEFPENNEVYRELFNAKKTIYNSEHNITVKGIPVEMYAQDAAEPHHSQGIYSVLNNTWLQIPRRRKADVDDVSVKSKFEEFESLAREAIKHNSEEEITALLHKIRTMRQAGLDAHGEFGPENLAFKLLRNTGTIQQLRDIRSEIRNQEENSWCN
jgi:DNA-binding FadR family transcriptional regulator